MQTASPNYAGFWIRFGSTIIDTILLLIITLPLSVMVYGWAYFDNTDWVMGPGDVLINWVLPMVAIIAFWIKRQATPGKMALSIKIADATTGAAPSAAQLIGRYFGYFIATIPLGLGLLWVCWDRKKQGWHDKLSGTVVVRSQRD